MAVQYDTLYTAVYFVPLSSIVNEEEALNTGMRVYPNPFTGHLYLKLSQDKVVEQVRISDMFGKEVFRRKMNGEADLPLEMLRPGIYILEITSSATAKTIVKIVKQ